MAWHWFPEGQEGIIAQLRRATVQKTDDSGTQQILKKMTGLKTETFEDVYRLQPHGFSSHPPSGSEGVFLSLGGRSDRLLALGFEHKDKRVRNLPEGGAVLYDADGNVVRIVADDLQITHKKKVVLTVGKSKVTIEPDKITHESPHVVVKSPHVDLGDEGGTPIGLCGGGCATKVYAV
ncbi:MULTISPECIES: phage baseplate assembly protein [unclassified Bradyrhizobium]|uniref:phage baseplate assembly protein domain-containing protein n=1 Tax=unclassified Bradyrhizobium TaxID=2631580 RepID=UPI002916168B|nr:MULTISPECIES: phage baseplate assembly protein [unclassified Bradyrhizobium]